MVFHLILLHYYDIISYFCLYNYILCLYLCFFNRFFCYIITLNETLQSKAHDSFSGVFDSPITFPPKGGLPMIYDVFHLLLKNTDIPERDRSFPVLFPQKTRKSLFSTFLFRDKVIWRRNLL